MAHVGQKGTLGVVCRFGGRACLQQFPCAFGDHFLQVQAIRVQLLADALLIGNVFLHRHVVGNAAIGLA